MNTIPYHRQLKDDIDPQETTEWLEALVAVMEREGNERAHFIIEALIDKARRIIANHFSHSQHFGVDTLSHQAGHVRIAIVTRENRQQK